MTNTARATRIVELARTLGMTDNLMAVAYQADMGDTATDLHRAIRDAFDGDDDFDDLVHEIEHVTDTCTDDGCPWNDEV